MNKFLQRRLHKQAASYRKLADQTRRQADTLSTEDGREALKTIAWDYDRLASSLEAEAKQV